MANALRTLLLPEAFGPSMVAIFNMRYLSIVATKYSSRCVEGVASNESVTGSFIERKLEMVKSKIMVAKVEISFVRGLILQVDCKFKHLVFINQDFNIFLTENKENRTFGRFRIVTVRHLYISKPRIANHY